MGDTDEVIYNRLRGGLVRYASVLVGPNDGPHLLSVVITRVLANRRLSDLDNPRLCLFRAVSDEVRAHRRRYARRQVLQLVIPDIGPTFELDVGLDAVMDLPVQQRAATYLVYWLGYTPSDAAAAMGCQPGTIDRYLHLASSSLKEVLDASGDDRTTEMFGSVYGRVDALAPEAPEWSATPNPSTGRASRWKRPSTALAAAAAALFLVLGGVAVLYASWLRPGTSPAGAPFEGVVVAVYLSGDIDADQLQHMTETLTAHSAVIDWRYVNKTEAHEEALVQWADSERLIQVLRENRALLPASIRLLTTNQADAGTIGVLALTMRGVTGVARMRGTLAKVDLPIVGTDDSPFFATATTTVPLAELPLGPWALLGSNK